MTTTLKLVISGASGFVGQQLVPRLTQAGCSLLLIGRDTARLTELFPDQTTSTYDAWPNHAQGFDAILNLAVVNNDSSGSYADFEQINVTLAETLAKQGLDIGIDRFLQFSSIHALDNGNTSPYAKSKRAAKNRLEALENLKLTTLYLPLVYGNRWPRSLNALNKLPKPLAIHMFRPLAALKATVHIDQIASTILRTIDTHRSACVVSDNVDENPWYRNISALIDYGFALSVLLFFWWGLLAITLWVRLTSPGPSVFAQDRIGKGGKTFTCYKFRTMQTGTPQAGTHEVAAASVTRVGAYLRRTKMDELPQVWNIIKGEIRLVGPRPGLPVQRALFEARKTNGVIDVTPGITGWAQIHDVDMSDPIKLARWDSDYIAMRSLLFDIKIIFATAYGKGQGDQIIETKERNTPKNLRK